MVAPLVLILFDINNRQDLIAAEQVNKQLEAKYRDFTFKQYWNPYLFSQQSTNITEEWQKALLEAAHIVVLFSHSFINEYKKQPTWELAFQRDDHFNKGIIIPICMENCDVFASDIPPVPTFHKLFELYTLQYDTPMRDDISEGLYRIFDEALAKARSTPPATAQPALPVPPTTQPAPPTSIEEPTTTPKPTVPLLLIEPFFSDPHFPDDRFINTPPRNRLFVGQNSLALIEQAYRRTQSAMSGTPNIFVLAGLRGSGKTQLAIEYAQRGFMNDIYRDVLWVHGGKDSRGARRQLHEMVNQLLLELRQKGKQIESGLDAESQKSGLATWLQKNQNWLLVFDGVDDVSHIMDYLPSRGNGHVLVTTCNQIVGNIAMQVLESMNEEDAVMFLLKRLRIDEYKTFDAIPSEGKKDARLIVQLAQCFPLALDQVGNFIDSAQSDLKRFVKDYQLEDKQALPVEFLADRGGPDFYHPLTLAECWLEHFRLLQEAHPVAADILLFCAFFNPQGTYHKIIIGGHRVLGPQYKNLPRTSLDSLVIQLRKYSLVQRGGPGNEMLVVHPLLSVILLDQLTDERRFEWAKRTIQAVQIACFHYPDDEPDLEERKRWKNPLEVCETLIEEWKLDDLDELAGVIQKLRDRKKKWT